MNCKKRLGLMCLPLLAILFLVGCRQEEQTPEIGIVGGPEVVDTSGMLEVLRIGLMPSVDAFPIVMAQALGFFDEFGLTVDLVPFSGAPYRDAAILAGEIHGATVDLIAVGLSQEAGVVPLQAAGVTSGMFTLMGKEGFTTVSDLAGETVAISQNTAIDLVLSQILSDAGYEKGFVDALPIPSIPSRVAYLRDGSSEVAAGIFPEPWASILLAEGFYPITNTLELDFVPFVMAFTDDAVENLSEEIEAFIKGYDLAVAWLNDAQLDEYFQTIVNVIGFPEEAANYLVVPTFLELLPPSTRVLEATITWLEARELIGAGHLTPSDLITQ